MSIKLFLCLFLVFLASVALGKPLMPAKSAPAKKMAGAMGGGGGHPLVATIVKGESQESLPVGGGSCMGDGGAGSCGGNCRK